MLAWCLSRAVWKASRDTTDASRAGVLAVPSGATCLRSVAYSSSCLFRFAAGIVGWYSMGSSSCSIAK